jgi:hypothetical protein
MTTYTGVERAPRPGVCGHPSHGVAVVMPAPYRARTESGYQFLCEEHAQAAYRALAQRDNEAMRAQLAEEIDPTRTVTHPSGITQVFASPVAVRGAGEPAIGAFRYLAERGAYATYAADGSSLGDYATADQAYEAIVGRWT